MSNARHRRPSFLSSSARRGAIRSRLEELMQETDVIDVVVQAPDG